MRFFADGAVAQHIRTQQGESTVLDQRYGLFLLQAELNDERLMRLRLERLLCWRESPERWSCYQHMTPVLILARSQRDHWQRAVEAASLKLCLDPLVGALACFSQKEKAQVNPWLLTWRTLANDVPCHLQELFKSVPRSAFPSSLFLEECEDEKPNAQLSSNAAARAVSSRATTRFIRLIVGGLANRAAHITQVGLDEQEMIALLGLRLTPCQWSILHLLLEHQLFSEKDLAGRSGVRCVW